MSELHKLPVEKLRIFIEFNLNNQRLINKLEN